MSPILDGLTDAETLLLAAGLCQYPIKVWQRIEYAKVELELLQAGWIWKNSSLKFAGIGSPLKIIESIIKWSRFKVCTYSMFHWVA